LASSKSTASVASRTGAFGESIFAEITALAKRHGALDLGQGYPDFLPPDFVVAAAARRAAGPKHQYSPLGGHPKLTQRVAERYTARLGFSVDPTTEVTVTAGATEALFASVLALVEPGDEVILIDPVYDAYPPNVVLAGGTPRHVPLHWREGRFRLDQKQLEACFNERTKLLMLNTPHNPTGKCFDKEELGWLAELCCRYDVFVISDEVYDEMVYDEHEHLHIASFDGMWDRTLTIGSAGKTFSVTGWKIGWVVGHSRLTTAVRRLHQWITFAVATPLQLAVADALDEAEQNDYYARLRADYQRRRDALTAALSAAELTVHIPEGTYFVTADVSAFDADGQLFCRHLVERLKLAAIPAVVFYAKHNEHVGRSLVRFCFAKQMETIERAAARLLAL
jgi:aspartate/methionine/tyrosine aminotransferase